MFLGLSIHIHSNLFVSDESINVMNIIYNQGCS